MAKTKKRARRSRYTRSPMLGSFEVGSMQIGPSTREDEVYRDHKDLGTPELNHRLGRLRADVEREEAAEVVLLADLAACRKRLKRLRADAEVVEALVEDRR